MGCGASAAAEPPSDPAVRCSQPKQAAVVAGEELRAVATPVETAAMAPTRPDEGPAQEKPEALTGVNGTGVTQAAATDSDEEPEPQTESDEEGAPAKAKTVTTGSALSEEEIAAIAQAAAGSVVPGPQAGAQAVVGRRASVSVAMGESGAAAAAAAAAAVAAAAVVAAAESIPE